MGAVAWRGGDQITVTLQGSMQGLLEQMIGDAIHLQPADPGAAIQGVIDVSAQDMPAQFKWVREAK